MNNTEYGIYKIPNKNKKDVPPTRACSICNFVENPESNLIYNIGWICPECKQRLKKILYSENNNGR